jgi:hypothetical protein
MFSSLKCLHLLSIMFMNICVCDLSIFFNCSIWSITWKKSNNQYLSKTRVSERASLDNQEATDQVEFSAEYQIEGNSHAISILLYEYELKSEELQSASRQIKTRTDRYTNTESSCS